MLLCCILFFVGLECTAYRILSWVYKALLRHYRYSTQRHSHSQLARVVGLGVFGNGAEVGEGHAVSSHTKHSRPGANCSRAGPLVDVLGRAEDHFGLPLLLGARSFCPYGPWFQGVGVDERQAVLGDGGIVDLE